MLEEDEGTPQRIGDMCCDQTASHVIFCNEHNCII